MARARARALRSERAVFDDLTAVEAAHSGHGVQGITHLLSRGVRRVIPIRPCHRRARRHTTAQYNTNTVKTNSGTSTLVLLVNQDLVWTDQPQDFPSHLLLPALVVGSKGVAPTAVLASCLHIENNSPSL